MALCGCTPGHVFIAAVTALVLLPAQYFVPDFHQDIEKGIQEEIPEKLSFEEIPAVDLLLAGVMVMIVVVVNLCDWIQKKLMERRIYKLNQYLNLSLERLRTMDAQQEELEATLKMVQNATAEYNLLLYLLLREHKILTKKEQSSNSYLDKTLDGEIDTLIFT